MASRYSIRRLVLGILFLCTAMTLHAQDPDSEMQGTRNPTGKKNYKFPAFFGFQYKPLIPLSVLGTTELEVTNGTFSGNYQQQFGYNFGGILRLNMTKSISLETGISMVRRNYSLDFNMPDSNLTASTSFGLISYEIPINALVFIQLDLNKFMNASLGLSVVYSPSNVRTYTNPYGKHAFMHEGRRYGSGGLFMFAIEMNAGVGFEIRTKENGTFYLGASGRVPFRPIYQVAAIYEHGSYTVPAYGLLSGSYVALDLRYYFHNSKKKSVQFIPGPIEH